MATDNTLTKVIKVTRSQYEQLLRGETINIANEAITYNDQHVYIIKEEKGLQYTEL